MLKTRMTPPKANISRALTELRKLNDIGKYSITHCVIT
jgi:hypothetical protein